MFENIKFLDSASNFLNEFNEYSSVVDYEHIFNYLQPDIKYDLFKLSEYYLEFFCNNGIQHLDFDYNLFLDSVCKLNLIELEINLYATTYKKVGIHVSLKNNDPIDSNFEILQHIYFKSVNYEDSNEFKNTLYNILFYAHIICTKFKFSPLLMYLYHEDDLDKLIEIRKRNIRLFNTKENCCVCIEQTITKTFCKHSLCQACYSSLITKNCPLCRECLT
jgi:hypothetical protein